MPTLPQTTRRERQREATYDEIVRVSRDLLAEGAELSLRAVAGRMGMTAPALYRYVGNYQELVDLVAFEIDKAATATFAAAADELPEDDYAGRLVVSVTEFRRWALRSPREFGLVFANPIADASCQRRELLTLASSGHLFTDQMRALWEHNHHPIPALDDLPETIRTSVLDPLIPAEVEGLATEDRGLVWIYMQGWTRLYGVVALEVFGHMDPRVIESGEMFISVVREFAPVIGVEDDVERLVGLVRARLALP
ncbi:TetR/AcrR family transcriptional regulator [Nocardioides sp. SYSU D00038]|uniref:TetR/AcrR family transcriptional regulator n=1 Tax=Nocardioides sp. SYSU D00038 TaxID=2812554 RepID=UPI0019680F30|nr:WHG domain-containing protein [Nocardioides sp. SYSU D00038]